MKTTGETIELRNLSIGYQTKHGIKTVATGIDGTIKSGELTCLLGANGVGKSTLLKTLSSFQPKTGGEILLEGRELSEYSDKQLSRLIGVVLTEKPDVQQMTAMELVEMGRAPYTGFWGRLCKDDLGGLDVDMVETAEAKAEFAEAVRSYGVSATPSDAWTDGKSLFIQYQQYEIVPYAYGAPLVTLPMEVARPYLSAELLELLDK